MTITDLGIESYRVTWQRQKDIFNSIINAKNTGNKYDEQILLVEHPHVYTLGFHGNATNMLLNEEQLSQQGIEFVRIERGGDITYHGPGQLVVYPIIDLHLHHLGVKSYINLLEEAVILTLKEFGITGERVDGATGVWIDVNTPHERKICAIGVKCSRFVTMHGLALNVNTDLSYFSAINPCGFIDKGVTSIEKELNQKVDFNYVKEIFSRIITNLLSSD